MRAQLLAVGGAVAAVSCPKGWDSDNGSLTRCFRSFTFAEIGSRDRGTWNEASKFCANSAAPLATVHHEAEEQFLHRILAQSEGPCWVGLRRTPQTDWLWIDDVNDNAKPDLQITPGRETRVSSTVERCGAANNDGFHERPCNGVTSRLKCFVCASVWEETAPEVLAALMERSHNFRGLSTTRWDTNMVNLIREKLGDALRGYTISFDEDMANARGVQDFILWRPTLALHETQDPLPNKTPWDAQQHPYLIYQEDEEEDIDDQMEEDIEGYHFDGDSNGYNFDGDRNGYDFDERGSALHGDDKKGDLLGGSDPLNDEEDPLGGFQTETLKRPASQETPRTNHFDPSPETMPTETASNQIPEQSLLETPPLESSPIETSSPESSPIDLPRPNVSDSDSDMPPHAGTLEDSIGDAREKAEEVSAELQGPTWPPADQLSVTSSTPSPISQFDSPSVQQSDTTTSPDQESSTTTPSSQEVSTTTSSTPTEPSSTTTTSAPRTTTTSTSVIPSTESATPITAAPVQPEGPLTNATGGLYNSPPARNSPTSIVLWEDGIIEGRSQSQDESSSVEQSSLADESDSVDESSLADESESSTWTSTDLSQEIIDGIIKDEIAREVAELLADSPTEKEEGAIGNSQWLLTAGVCGAVVMAGIIQLTRSAVAPTFAESNTSSSTRPADGSV